MMTKTTRPAMWVSLVGAGLAFLAANGVTFLADKNIQNMVLSILVAIVPLITGYITHRQTFSKSEVASIATLAASSTVPDGSDLTPVQPETDASDLTMRG